MRTGSFQETYKRFRRYTQRHQYPISKQLRGAYHGYQKAVRLAKIR
nr:MAG TPA: hypothetical protein [Caudoviricetes sp.]